MAGSPKKSKAEIATIDVCLVTIETKSGEFGFETSSKLTVEPQIETTEAIKLIIKGVLKAQKPPKRTLTGNNIVLTDNVFNPELVLALQGGKITYDTSQPKKIIGYEPPAIGSTESGEKFKLNAYSAQYDEGGNIVQYEKISYPECKGVPVAFGCEDGAFRAPEYTIESTPSKGVAPYTITYVSELPTLAENA